MTVCSCITVGHLFRLTVWHSVAASALEGVFKKERSRARSGQLQCRVGRGRQPDRFPMRYVEACAASLNRPTHQASISTPQAEAQAPQACAASQRQPTHEAWSETPQAVTVSENKPSDEACDTTPQAYEKVPQASRACSSVPSDEACDTAHQALAASLKQPSDQASAMMSNRAASGRHVPSPARPTEKFSRRARTQQHGQNAHDRVRAAVGWNAMFGDPVAVARVAGRMGRPHPYGTTPATTGVRSGSRAAGITSSTTGVDRHHTHRESR